MLSIEYYLRNRINDPSYATSIHIDKPFLMYTVSECSSLWHDVFIMVIHNCLIYHNMCPKHWNNRKCILIKKTC